MIIPTIGMFTSALFVDKIGRVLLIRTCLLFSCLPLLVIAFFPNKISIIYIFAAMSVYVFATRLLKSVTNAFTPESYPTKSRGTGKGYNF